MHGLLSPKTPIFIAPHRNINRVTVIHFSQTLRDLRIKWRNSTPCFIFLASSGNLNHYRRVYHQILNCCATMVSFKILRINNIQHTYIDFKRLRILAADFLKLCNKFQQYIVNNKLKQYNKNIRLDNQRTTNKRGVMQEVVGSNFVRPNLLTLTLDDAGQTLI